MTRIKLHESNKDEASLVNKLVPEFHPKYIEKHFDEKVKNNEHLILIASYDNKPAGFSVWYDKYTDGSFFCWTTGVAPEYRNKDILKTMMRYGFKWAKNKNYQKIRIRTKNIRREMLAYLVKYNFMFTQVNEYENIEDNQIELEKHLI